MGIKNLHVFLRKHLKKIGKYEEVYKDINLRDLKGKRIAIDVSIYLYKYKCINRDGWMSMFLSLMDVLKKNGIRMVMVFDGPGLPAKKVEHKRRKERQIKLRNRIKEFETMYNTFLQTGNLHDELLKLYEKKIGFYGSVLKLETDKSKLINKALLGELIEKKKNQDVKIFPKDIQNLKKLFLIHKIPYFVAKHEAEALCSSLCVLDKVDAVLSEDTDILCYKTPLFMFKINTMTNRCNMISFSSLLKALNWTSEQFIDFCIMCGTDYNSNIPRVGPVKSFKFIDELKTVENIEKKHEKLDTSCLNYNICKNVFQNDNNNEAKQIQIVYDKEPIDDKQLKEFYFIHNL